LSQEELAAIDAAFRKQRELQELRQAEFLDWVHQTVEAGEKAELNQEIRDLELESESLGEMVEEDSEPVSREAFERDMALSDAAEVLADMLVEELNDAVEPSEIQQETEQAESDAESEEPE
jgi:hypothetical protein